VTQSPRNRIANAPVSFGAFELTVGIMPGVAGQFFKQFGLTVAGAVFFSSSTWARAGVAARRRAARLAAGRNLFMWSSFV